MTRVWAERGSRPAAPRDQRYSWADLFGAICPARGTGAALVLPFANTDMMTLHLAEISATVATGAHAVLTIDGAGWHQTGGRLRVPSNITLLHLPPYSPELNPVENVWAYLRSNELTIACSTPTKPSSTHAVMRGAGLPHNQTASPQSAGGSGRVSLNETERISRLFGRSIRSCQRNLIRLDICEAVMSTALQPLVFIARSIASSITI